MCSQQSGLGRYRAQAQTAAPERRQLALDAPEAAETSGSVKDRVWAPVRAEAKGLWSVPRATDSHCQNDAQGKNPEAHRECDRERAPHSTLLDVRLEVLANALQLVFSERALV